VSAGRLLTKVQARSGFTKNDLKPRLMLVACIGWRVGCAFSGAKPPGMPELPVTYGCLRIRGFKVGWWTWGMLAPSGPKSCSGLRLSGSTYPGGACSARWLRLLNAGTGSLEAFVRRTGYLPVAERNYRGGSIRPLAVMFGVVRRAQPPVRTGRPVVFGFDS